MTESQKGSFLILTHSVLWGIFPVLSVGLLKSIHPLTLFFLSSLSCAVFLFVILAFKKKLHELKNLSAWKDIFFVGLFASIFFYGLILWGMQYTTANNAGVLMIAEVFFSFLIIHTLSKELPQKTEILGAICIISGVIVFKNPVDFAWNAGDAFILLATFLVTFGGIFMQKARKKVSAETILLGRNIIAIIFSGILVMIFSPSFPSLSFENPLLWGVFLHGAVLMGLAKIFWIEGISKISIPNAVSLNSIYPLFTLVFAFFFLLEIPKWYEMAGIVPMLLGVFLLVRK